MLKLLKYNVLNFWKKHLLVILIIVANLIMWKGLNLLNANQNLNASLLTIISYFETITSSILLISIIFLPVFTLVLSIIRYKKKVLSDEGYLTHTLPIKKRDILDASILNLLIFIIIDVLIILLTIGFRYGFYEITYFMQAMLSNNLFESGLVIALLVIIFTNFFNQVILALTLGYSRETNKVKNTVIFGVVIYLVNQALGTVLFGLIFLISFITKIDISRIMLVLLPLFYLMVFIVTYIIIDKTLNNRLNLE